MGPPTPDCQSVIELIFKVLNYLFARVGISLLMRPRLITAGNKRAANPPNDVLLKARDATFCVVSRHQFSPWTWMTLCRDWTAFSQGFWSNTDWDRGSTWDTTKWLEDGSYSTSLQKHTHVLYVHTHTHISPPCPARRWCRLQRHHRWPWDHVHPPEPGPPDPRPVTSADGSGSQNLEENNTHAHAGWAR